jgi:hypothetical protein
VRNSRIMSLDNPKSSAVKLLGSASLLDFHLALLSNRAISPSISGAASQLALRRLPSEGPGKIATCERPILDVFNIVGRLMYHYSRDIKRSL